MKLVNASVHFDGAVRSYRVESLRDDRGALTPFEFDGLPFTPVRAFLVEAPRGTVRGGHAHRAGRQFLVRVSGDIGISLKLGGEGVSLVLNECENAVLIAAPVWSQQSYLTDDARLLVFCDTPYDHQSYLNRP